MLQFSEKSFNPLSVDHRLFRFRYNTLTSLLKSIAKATS